MQIICNNKNKKKNVLGISVERKHFHKWFCAINLHYFLGSSWEEDTSESIFHAVRGHTKVHVQGMYQADQPLHLGKIVILASDQKYVYFFLHKGMRFKWPGFCNQHGNKKKSLNKIDYNQLHSLIRDDKWSDFSERSLVKLNFQIFNSEKKSLSESPSSTES